MKTARPETALENVLMGLERELIDATDEEVRAAAAELGMNPSMKGSAAFLGVKSPLLRMLSPGQSSSDDDSPTPSRRSKGDAPTST
jgi:hypothetical protein